jgi:hypothetical protein
VVDQGSAFTLTVEVAEAPSAGYIGIQTQVRYNALEYAPAAAEEDEVAVSEDGFPGILVRSTATAGRVAHGMTAGTPPSFTTSDYTGPILALAFTCTDGYSRNDVQLTPYSDDNTLGSGFKLPQDAGSANVPAGDSLLIHCGEPPPGAEETAVAAGPEATQAAATAAAAGATPADPTRTAIARATGTAIARTTATAAAEATNGTDDDDGGNTGLWIALASLAGVAVLAGAGGAAYYWRRTHR